MKRVLLVSSFLLLTFILPLDLSSQAKDVYESQCASCHASNGSGATAAGKKLGVIDLRSKEVRSMSDEELFESIAYGVKHKEYPHAFGRRGMSTDQINDLVAFIRKLPAHK